MKATFSLRKHHYLRRAGVFLIAVALIAGMVGCAPASEPLLGVGEYNWVGMREWVGGPVWYAGNNTPNGAILFISDPSPLSLLSVTNQTYEVTGSSIEEVENDIFDPEDGKGPEKDGTRYAGKAEWTFNFKWEHEGTNEETGDLVIHITDFTWGCTVTLPHWDPPEGTDQGDVDAWNEFLEELDRHEQGHVDIANDGLAAVQKAVVCTNIEVERGTTNEETINNINDAVRDHITGTQEYDQMEQTQDNYDAPYDPDTNPTGTNHGTENGQNAVLGGG